MHTSRILLFLAPFVLVSCFGSKTPAPVVKQPNITPITCSGSGVLAPNGIAVISYTGTVVSNGKVFDATSIGNRGPRPIKLGTGQFPAAFDRSIVCMKIGESRTFTLVPEDAYGKKTIESEFVKAAFGTGAESLKEGSEYTLAAGMKVRVVKIGDKRVTALQPNTHPLAGEGLRYEVHLDEVR